MASTQFHELACYFHILLTNTVTVVYSMTIMFVNGRMCVYVDSITVELSAAVAVIVMAASQST